VAVTTAVAAAISAWVELRRMDATIQNYSTVVLELGIVRDFWTGLDGEKRTGDQFFKLVGAVERVLWTQHNKFIAEMRRAVAALEEDHADLLETALAAPVHAEIEDALKMENYNEAERERKRIERLKQEFEVKRLAAMEGLEEGVERLENLEDLEQAARKLMGADQRADGRITAATRRALRARPHAFVVMPFGRKKGLDGAWIDFNAVYQELIKPALIEAGFEPFRADDATETGDILTDMFQELLLADLVICDLSIDNANVFYELGIRHAFRKRGVVHIQSGRAYMPFDIFNVRTIPYQLDSSGKPDSEHLRKDIQMVARVCTDTYNSDRDAIHSPVFNLLSGLDEPNRRALRTAAATGFWREYNEWREHMEIAKRQKRIGDILLLTEEIRNPLIKEEAIGEAGEALKTLKQHELAIAQYRAGQELNDRNHNFRREEAFHLNRLGRVDEAIVKLEKIIEMQPGDSEAIAALGRIYRQMWSEIWTGFTRKDKRKREAFASAHWLIKSVNTYLKAYKVDQNNYYPGINALTWSTVLINLADDCNDISNPDVEHIRDWLPQLNGAVQFALERETDAESTDYWALASLAELYVTSALDPTKVERAYKKALTASKKSAFYLESSLGQLNVLESLGFRPDYVKVGKDILLEELQRIRSEDGDEKPSAETDQPASQEFIYLFSGHMLDTQDANPQVFPPEMEAEVVKRLTAAMTEWDADANDVGVVVGAAAGGDILFIEECLRRDMLVEVLLPYDESTYVAKYIAEISDEWVTRYYDCRNHPRVAIYIQTDHIGDPKRGDDPIERNNRWGMFTALAKGVDRLRFLALWDGRSDPGSYGAIINDMIDDVRGIGGRVVHLNTSKFDYFNNRRPGRSKARELIISRLEQGFAEDEPAAEVDPAGQPTAADMAMTEESESKIAGNGASIKAKE
jgi:tetratricopeptide (TPR) repeat protein